jgi:hypothetical protein
LISSFCSDIEVWRTTPFVRDEDQEEAVQKLIFESARGPKPDGDVDYEFTDFLKDVDEGLESKEIRRDNEVSIKNSGEVYIYVSSLCSSLDALIYLYCTY